MTQTSQQATREQYARAEAERQARQQRHTTTANAPAAVPNTNKLPATPTNNKAVALPDTRTPVARYLDDIAPSGIVGQMIKFKDKRFIITETEEAISEDAEFVAILDQTLIGYVRFLEDAPPVRVQGLLYDGFVMPERCDLGDNDESQWPTGIDGSSPVDPWQHQICMVLQKRETGEFYTFVTSSVTGRRACGQLLRHYDRMRRTTPDELPIVKLKVGGFAHRDERIGWVSTPAFAVVGRIKKDAAPMPDMPPTDLDDGVPWLP